MDLKNTIWNQNTYNNFINYLNTLKDEKYKNFNDKIINTKMITIGIRVPILRKITKELIKTNYIELLKFMKDSNIYEIVFIEGLIISNIKDFNEFENKFTIYLNKVDNWAITDMVANSLKIIDKNEEKSLKLIDKLLNSKKTFNKRMGYVILLDYFVKEEYLDLIFNYIKNEKSSEYYVQMAASWLISECFIKYQNETYEFLKTNKIDEFILKKTISKINDSYRVSKEMKKEIKNLI